MIVISFITELEVPPGEDDDHHKHKVHQIDREKIFPLQREKLVDAQTGIRPLEPDNHE